MQAPTKTTPGPQDVSASRLTSNLLTLGRDLRRAGLSLGSGQIMSLVEAVGEIDCRRQDDFYHAARATLVTSPEQIPVFDAEFARFWRRLTTIVPDVETFLDDEPVGATGEELSLPGQDR